MPAVTPSQAQTASLVEIYTEEQFAFVQLNLEELEGRWWTGGRATGSGLEVSSFFLNYGLLMVKATVELKGPACISIQATVDIMVSCATLVSHKKTI